MSTTGRTRRKTVEMIVDDDDLEVAVTGAMKRGDTEIHFVVVSKRNTDRLTGKRIKSAGIRTATNKTFQRTRHKHLLPAPD